MSGSQARCGTSCARNSRRSRSNLPADFAFSEFKVIGSGVTRPSLCRSGVATLHCPRAASRISSSNFTDSSGFAFAASKNYVNGLLDPLFDAVKEAVRDFKKEITIGVTVFGVRLQQTIKFTLQLRVDVPSSNGGPGATSSSRRTSSRGEARPRRLVQVYPEVQARARCATSR